MAVGFAEKLKIAAVTATLVSACWIVAGTVLLDGNAGSVTDNESLDGAGPDTSIAETPVRTPAAPDEPIDRTAVVMPSSDEARGLLIPVEGVARDQLLDTFADERGGGDRLHEAIDIMAPEGTPVLSVANGMIERMYRSDAGGITLYLRSEDRRTIYYYAHLASYAPGLEEGQSVIRGEPIASVGSTGNANVEAPHLHFEIMRTSEESEWWEPSTSINPYPLLGGR